MSKQTVILSGFIDKVPFILRGLNVLATANFEQVLALAKLNEISKLAILICAYNYSKSTTNNCSGKKAAEEIHLIDPSIPILIWQGIESTDTDIYGANETYYNGNASEFLVEMRKFFNGQ